MSAVEAAPFGLIPGDSSDSEDLSSSACTPQKDRRIFMSDNAHELNDGLVPNLQASFTQKYSEISQDSVLTIPEVQTYSKYAYSSSEIITKRGGDCIPYPLRGKKYSNAEKQLSFAGGQTTAPTIVEKLLPSPRKNRETPQIRTTISGEDETRETPETRNVSEVVTPDSGCDATSTNGVIGEKTGIINSKVPNGETNATSNFNGVEDNCNGYARGDTDISSLTENGCAGTGPVEPTSTSADDSSNNTILIFDWDDTLFPSTWLSLQELTLDEKCRIPPNKAVILNEMAECSKRLLKVATSLGTVVIVTNAEEGWIDLSCRKFLPSLYDYLAQFKQLSARTKYEKQISNCPFTWKQMAFRDEIYSHFQNVSSLPQNGRDSNFCVVSLGDSAHERLAVISITKLLPFTKKKPSQSSVLGGDYGGCIYGETASTADVNSNGSWGTCRTKSIKFIERPGIDELMQEHGLIINLLEGVVKHNDDMDLYIRSSGTSSSDGSSSSLGKSGPMPTHSGSNFFAPTSGSIFPTPSVSSAKQQNTPLVYGNDHSNSGRSVKMRPKSMETLRASAKVPTGTTTGRTGSSPATSVSSGTRRIKT